MSFFDRIKSKSDNLHKKNSVSEEAPMNMKKELVYEIQSFKEDSPKDYQIFQPFESFIKRDYEEYYKRCTLAENPLDYTLNIYVSADKMTAFCCLFPPVSGGKNVTEELLLEDLQLEGITNGIDRETLSLAAKSRQYYRIFVVARGNLPSDGVDGTIIDYIERRERVNTEPDKNKVVNFDRPELFYSIKKGEVICRIEPPKKGIDGYTVVGGKIPAKNGFSAKIPQGTNTIVSKDGSVLLAGTSGHVSFKDGAFSVDDTLVFDNLEPASTPLDFMKNITVTGDVKDGVVINARGNVMIGGKVGAATIRSGGNIYIQGGMDGKNLGHLVAVGEVKCRNLANATVVARGNIYADSIVQSDVTTSGSVYVNGGKGVLSGGITRVEKCLEARKVGNQSERINLIFLSFNIKIQREIDKKEQTLSTIDSNLNKIAAILKQVKNVPSYNKDTIAQLKKQKDLFLAEKTELTKQVDKIYSDSRDKRICYMTAENILPHTIVDYMGEKLAIKEPLKNCRIFYDKKIILTNS